MSEEQKVQPVVLQVLPELEQGGVERGTIEIAAELQKRGIKNFVASKGGRMSYNLDRIKVPQLVLPLKSKNPFTIMRNAKKMEKFIKENGVNVVHARSRAPAWSAYFAAKRCGVHFVTTFHGTYGLGFLGLKKLYNRVMTYGEKVIAISEHIRKHILKNYKKTPENNLVLIHRCVNIESFAPEAVTPERMINIIKEYNLPEDKPIILLIGRLTSWKGQRLLIEAAAKLKEKEFHCVFVGDDQGRVKYTDSLRKLIKDRGLAGRFTFIKNIFDGPAMMMMSDIVVSASTEPEAFGRIAIEGQAMGKIVAASNIGGSLETVIDGETGRLFESGNAESLAEVLDWALSLNVGERKKISAAAIKNVREHFTKQIMCDKTIKVYEELANKRQ